MMSEYSAILHGAQMIATAIVVAVALPWLYRMFRLVFLATVIARALKKGVNVEAGASPKK